MMTRTKSVNMSSLSLIIANSHHNSSIIHNTFLLEIKANYLIQLSDLTFFYNLQGQSYIASSPVGMESIKAEMKRELSILSVNPKLLLLKNPPMERKGFTTGLLLLIIFTLSKFNGKRNFF